MARHEAGAGNGDTAERERPRVSRIPDATPISRILRFLFGAVLLAWMLPRVVAASAANQVEVWAVVLGLTIFYGLVHWLVGRYLGGLHPWLGALVLVVGPIALLLQLGPKPSAGVILYIGLSLVLIAARGEPGCEVLAIPAAISRRPTHLACLIFSPLDWIEHRLLGRARGSTDG